MTLSAFGPIIFWFFILSSLSVTILLVIKTVKRFQTSQESKTSVILKMVFALIIWLGLTLYIFVIIAIYSGVGGDYIGSTPRMVEFDFGLVVLIAHFFLWLLAGFGLIYWLGRQSKTTKLN